MARLYWRDVGLAMGSFLAITYVFCVAYDLAFGQRMFEVWLKLLPGFTWISWPSFFLGLLENNPIREIHPLEERRDFVVSIVPLPQKLECQVDLGLGLDRDSQTSRVSQSTLPYHTHVPPVNEISVLTRG